MTSKEALEELVAIYNGIQYDVEDIIELFDAIKQDLERLEVLKNNSNKVVKDSVKLINKNLELQQENEKLKNAFEIIKNKRVLISNLNYYFKLENGLKLYNSFKNREEELTQQEYDLLNEVLGE